MATWFNSNMDERSKRAKIIEEENKLIEKLNDLSGIKKRVEDNMKIRINKDIIKSFSPCSGRFDNYLKRYSDFDADILKFLDLKHISHSDKLWVTLRVMPRHLVEVFAIDMAFAAQEYAYAAYATTTAADADAAAAAYAADAAYATTIAAYDAYDAADAARQQEQQNQINVLKYLIESED